MATSKDYERLWKRYNEEARPAGKSIVTYCQENGIIYSQFENWFKKNVKSEGSSSRIVPVEILDIPGVEAKAEPAGIDTPSARHDARIRSLSIQFKNGLEVRHQNISYRTLVDLVGRLEAIC